MRIHQPRLSLFFHVAELSCPTERKHVFSFWQVTAIMYAVDKATVTATTSPAANTHTFQPRAGCWHRSFGQGHVNQAKKKRIFQSGFASSREKGGNRYPRSQTVLPSSAQIGQPNLPLPLTSTSTEAATSVSSAARDRTHGRKRRFLDRVIVAMSRACATISYYLQSPTSSREPPVALGTGGRADRKPKVSKRIRSNYLLAIPPRPMDRSRTWLPVNKKEPMACRPSVRPTGLV